MITTCIIDDLGHPGDKPFNEIMDEIEWDRQNERGRKDFEDGKRLLKDQGITYSVFRNMLREKDPNIDNIKLEDDFIEDFKTFCQQHAALGYSFDDFYSNDYE